MAISWLATTADDRRASPFLMSVSSQLRRRASNGRLRRRKSWALPASPAPLAAGSIRTYGWSGTDQANGTVSGPDGALWLTDRV